MGDKKGIEAPGRNPKIKVWLPWFECGGERWLEGSHTCTTCPAGKTPHAWRCPRQVGWGLAQEELRGPFQPKPFFPRLFLCVSTLTAMAVPRAAQRNTSTAGTASLGREPWLHRSQTELSASPARPARAPDPLIWSELLKPQINFHVRMNYQIEIHRLEAFTQNSGNSFHQLQLKKHPIP